MPSERSWVSCIIRPPSFVCALILSTFAIACWNRGRILSNLHMLPLSSCAALGFHIAYPLISNALTDRDDDY